MTMVHSRSAVPGTKSKRLCPTTDRSRAITGGHHRTTSVLNHGTVSLSDKSKYQAGQDLLVTRSDSYLIRPHEKLDDIWKRPPPDFTLQRYMPKPPKRNTRESMQPWRWGTFPGEKKVAQTTAEKPAVTLPKILQPPRPRSRKILTRFNIPDSDEARKQAVKSLVHPKEGFENPQPHDFRQYPPLGPLGLPEFLTASDKDPYNIKFKTENMDIVYGLPPQLSDRFNGLQIGQDVLKQPPKFEQHLLHPKGKWPSPSGEFSRYRARNRSPTTVLMDNVEDTLTKKWALEKQERLRRKKEREEAEKKLIFEEKVAKEVAKVSKKTKDLEARDNEFGAWHDHLHMKNSRGHGGSAYSTISSNISSDL